MTLAWRTDRAGVDAVHRGLREVRKRERHPPAISPDAGWSPYAAQAFLADQDLVARDYHRSFDEWFAQAEPRRFKTGIFDSTMTYSLTGNALAATRLKLALDARFPGDTDGVDRLFYEFAETLLHHANGEDARAVVAALSAEGRGGHQCTGSPIVLARARWG